MKDGLILGLLFFDCVNINFVVWSNKILLSFNIGEFDIFSKIEFGIIDFIFDIFGKCNENVFILCDDVKKVIVGVDGIDGDVDMFGFDSGMFLI